MCNKEVHELLIQEDYVNCVFCNKQIQDPSKPERYFCCEFIYYLFIYRFVQCTGERTIAHVVPYLVHPHNPAP